MGFCNNCGAKLGRTTVGTLCKKCYPNRNQLLNGTATTPSSDAGGGNDTSDDIIMADLGLNDDILQNLPELPSEWYKQDLRQMNAGHLVRIMRCFFQPIQEELKSLKNKIGDMEKGIQSISTITTDHTVKLKDTEEDLKDKGKEIELIKKAVFNQQVFLENLQKKDLKNNMIITGIPNGELVIDDVTLQSDEEKVAGILHEIGDNISTDCYKLLYFPAAENRTTHVCKVTFNDFNVKMNVIKNAKKLKDIESLRKVFLQWDDPKLTRQENQRLRKAKWELKQSHPNDNLELRKGILKRNNQQVDKFNLMNQIF